MDSLVVVIIVNFNGSKDTIECLESVFKLKYNNFKVIVVDNSPDENEVEYIVNWANGQISNINTCFREIVYPLINKPLNCLLLREVDKLSYSGESLILIKAKENRGFAAGNNIGIQFANDFIKPDFIWLLNNDTVVLRNALAELLKKIDEKNKVGIVGSCLCYYHDRFVIQGIGGVYNQYFATTSHYLEGSIYCYDMEINEDHIDYPIGASMLVASSFISEVGLMNEVFFLYFEELDWIIRGQQKGWEFKIALNSLVFHKEGQSIGTKRGKSKSLLSDYWSLRNRILFSKIHNKKYLIFIYLSFIIVLINRLRRFQYDKFYQVLRVLFTT